MFFRRYVDDTFLIANEEKNVETTLDAFYDVHPTIRFTSEREERGKFVFLDVKLERKEDGHLERSVLRK